MDSQDELRNLHLRSNDPYSYPPRVQSAASRNSIEGRSQQPTLEDNVEWHYRCLIDHLSLDDRPLVTSLRQRLKRLRRYTAKGPNSFNNFVKKQWNIYATDGQPISEVMKIMGAVWRDMPEAEKESFGIVDLHIRSKAEYKQKRARRLMHSLQEKFEELWTLGFESISMICDTRLPLEQPYCLSQNIVSPARANEFFEFMSLAHLGQDAFSRYCKGADLAIHLQQWAVAALRQIPPNRPSQLSTTETGRWNEMKRDARSALLRQKLKQLINEHLPEHMEISRLPSRPWDAFLKNAGVEIELPPGFRLDHIYVALERRSGASTSIARVLREIDTGRIRFRRCRQETLPRRLSDPPTPEAFTPPA